LNISYIDFDDINISYKKLTWILNLGLYTIVFNFKLKLLLT